MTQESGIKETIKLYDVMFFFLMQDYNTNVNFAVVCLNKPWFAVTSESRMFYF